MNEALAPVEILPPIHHDLLYRHWRFALKAWRWSGIDQTLETLARRCGVELVLTVRPRWLWVVVSGHAWGRPPNVNEFQGRVEATAEEFL